MRKLLLAISIALCSLALKAQPDALHSIEIAGGAGWSNIDYKLTEMRQQGDIGGIMHLGYNVHATSWLSFGIGVDMEADGANATGSISNKWTGVTDTDGEKYDHQLLMSNWRERQHMWLLQIPVAIQFIVPSDKASFSIQLGAKWGTKIAGSARTKGMTTHSGYYEPWHLTLNDMEPFGFYTTEYSDRQKLTTATNNTWHVFGKVGVIVPLSQKLYFTAHLYADYSLTDLLKQPDSTKPIGVKNDKEGMETIHYFMPEYTSILDTDIADLKTSKLLNVGLEIGLRYVLKTRKHSHKKKYPCRCVMN